MKIKLRIRDVAEFKGIENPFELSKRTGVNYAICHRLWNSEQRRIDLGTLEKICEALRVTPGELFEYDWKE